MATATAIIAILLFIGYHQTKLCKLKIYNDGPGTIKFSSNLPRSDQQAEIQLNAGEFDDSLSFVYNIIWSLNISVLSGGAPVVRVFYVV
jgi:hypothetical protein